MVDLKCAWHVGIEAVRIMVCLVLSRLLLARLLFQLVYALRHARAS
jgi:hypothetical protein